MPDPKKNLKLSLRERVKRARRKMSLRRKKYEYPDEWVAHAQLVNAYLAYDADVGMESLIFLGKMRVLINGNVPVEPRDIQKMRKLWDDFVRPLLEGDVS